MPWFNRYFTYAFRRGLRHKKTKSPNSAPPAQNAEPVKDTVDGDGPSPEGTAKSTVNIEPATLEKFNSILNPFLAGDEKKAKKAYARSYRVLPEFVQFAFDLRFKNYDHALTVLPKTPWEENEKTFWAKILHGQPASLPKVICNGEKVSPLFPQKVEPTAEEKLGTIKFLRESLMRRSKRQTKRRRKKRMPSRN